ncbi:MAG TPA: peptidylprolyl isomerase [Polyangiaceae bacterium]|nr:peptidylprolyl isomerase [Polyangiaceae bacterium]
MARERAGAISTCAAFAVVITCVACRGTRSSNAKTTVTAAPPAAAGADGSPVLAEFDGRVLTLLDFDERLSRQPLALRVQYKNVEARRRLLDDMVRLELLADEARRRGIDQRPEIRDRISELLAEEVTNQVLATDAKAGEISDDEVKAYYDAHSAEFHVPEERSAIVLLLDRRERADDVLRRAAAHPRDEAFFRGLVRGDGRTATVAPRSFDSGFFSKTTSGGLPAAVRDAVFDMRSAGDIHPVVASDGAFYVLMLTGIRPALVREPKDVAALVRERLRAERRSRALSDFMDGLRARGHASVHPERLGATEASAPTPATSASAARSD